MSACFFGGGTQARIEVTPMSGAVPLTIQFDGSGSTGPGGITGYRWSFGTGAEANTATGTYTYTHTGTYTLTLTVRTQNGSTATSSVQIVVKPAMWITDHNLNCIYKLDMSGSVLATFALPLTQPQGITTAEVDGKTWLFVACENGGVQRIARVDPATGVVDHIYSAPAQDPRNLTYSTTEPKRIWHVDALSRKIYSLNRTDLQSIDAFGQNYFKSTSPQVGNVPFLWTPEGLDWTPEQNTSGYLWYLEGETHLLYKIKIIPSYDFMAGTQLKIVGTPIELAASLFPIAAIDFYNGNLWVIDVNHHAIVVIDPTTGEPTGQKITGFPGSAPAGLEIQR